MSIPLRQLAQECSLLIPNIGKTGTEDLHSLVVRSVFEGITC